MATSRDHQPLQRKLRATIPWAGINLHQSTFQMLVNAEASSSTFHLNDRWYARQIAYMLLKRHLKRVEQR